MIGVEQLRRVPARREQLLRDPTLRRHLAAALEARLRSEAGARRRRQARIEAERDLELRLRQDVARCRGCGEWCWGQRPCAVCGRPS